MKYVTTPAQKRRRLLKKFASLLTTPAAGAITMPSAGKVVITSLAGATAGTVAATITGPHPVSVKTPTLAAGQRLKVMYVEKGSVITPSANFRVYIEVGLGKLRKIGGS